MIKNLKRTVLALSAAILLAMPVFAPAALAADNVSGGLKCGANLDAASIINSGDPACDVDASGASSKVNDTIKLIINIFSLVVGIAAVIMIIIGGLKYIISGGDASNVTGAKNTILYAIVGLVVVALSQFVVRYVLSRVTTQ
jgi:hypothetical protein